MPHPFCECSTNLTDEAKRMSYSSAKMTKTTTQQIQQKGALAFQIQILTLAVVVPLYFPFLIYINCKIHFYKLIIELLDWVCVKVINMRSTRMVGLPINFLVPLVSLWLQSQRL